ncbi:RNA polymerase subunit sigma-24 [Nocardioides sp. Soil797]|nr:RNA polymerase subunit sigma-24 [Nocardioides sp. Soil797]
MSPDELPELLKLLGPQVLRVLVRRGADFAAAEDAVQEALVSAVQHWPDDAPAEPKGWLVSVAWRKYVDMVRGQDARRRREERFHDEPPSGATENVDDSLELLFLCCHPDLTPSAAIALTLRAVGGLTTRQIALAHLVPEATMAQRISRAKRTIADRGLGAPGDLGRVLKVLYLIFNEGYGGSVDLAAEAIRLTRQLTEETSDPEVGGLLALMLLHDARRTSRRTASGDLVPLAEQDRSSWDTDLIAEGVTVLQSALALDRLGEYQAQAAIAALHADAPTADETDWPQILEWYDELLRLVDSPVAALNRVVALGEVDGPLVALKALDALPADLPRHTAVRAHFTERAGSLEVAASLYAEAAALATSIAERDHLVRQAARLRHP